MPGWNLGDYRLFERLVAASVIDHHRCTNGAMLIDPLRRIGLKSDTSVGTGGSQLIVSTYRHGLVIIGLT